MHLMENQLTGSKATDKESTDGAEPKRYRKIAGERHELRKKLQPRTENLRKKRESSESCMYFLVEYTAYTKE